MINRYLMNSQSFRYLDVLSDIVQSYNMRPHRSLGGTHTPATVTTENANEVRLDAYLAGRKKKKDFVKKKSNKIQGV